VREARVGTVFAPHVDIAPTKIGKQVLGAPAVGQEGLIREEYLLVVVGAKGARQEIRGWLGERGWSEPEDYRTMV